MDKEQAIEILKFISKTNKLNIKSEVFDEAEKHDFKLESDAIDVIMNELDKYQEEHEILLEELKSRRENKRWRADENYIYFYIDDDLDVIEEVDDSIYDDDRYKYHNYFKTKEEAQAVADNIKTHIELMELAEELNLEHIDWNDEEQYKFYIYYNFYSEEIETDSDCSSKHANTVYCINFNFKDEAIKRIGKERLVRYLKGE